MIRMVNMAEEDEGLYSETLIIASSHIHIQYWIARLCRIYINDWTESV